MPRMMELFMPLISTNEKVYFYTSSWFCHNFSKKIIFVLILETVISSLWNVVFQEYKKRKIEKRYKKLFSERSRTEHKTTMELGTDVDVVANLIVLTMRLVYVSELSRK